MKRQLESHEVSSQIVRIRPPHSGVSLISPVNVNFKIKGLIAYIKYHKANNKPHRLSRRKKLIYNGIQAKFSLYHYLLAQYVANNSEKCVIQ